MACLSSIRVTFGKPGTCVCPGRNSNSPSEDPLLTGLWGAAIVRGTQSPVNGVNLINSQMKHWTACVFLLILP